MSIGGTGNRLVRLALGFCIGWWLRGWLEEGGATDDEFDAQDT